MNRLSVAIAISLTLAGCGKSTDPLVATSIRMVAASFSNPEEVTISGGTRESMVDDPSKERIRGIGTYGQEQFEWEVHCVDGTPKSLFVGDECRWVNSETRAPPD